MRRLLLLLLLTAPILAATPVRLCGIGASMMYGVRPDGSVKPGQEFMALLAARLNADGVPATEFDWGFPGAHIWPVEGKLSRPRSNLPLDVALVMFESNDAYARGTVGAANEWEQPRVATSTEDYTACMRQLLVSLRDLGAKPILMTSPPYAPPVISGNFDSYGLPLNVLKERYMRADRALAAELAVPLVDHWQDWTAAGAAGIDMHALTVDGCHPNPAGHRRMADLIYPVLRQVLGQ